jgi:GTP cyclohydrolase I
LGSGVGVVGGICGLSMGALDEEHFNKEIENGVELDCLDLGFEDQLETVAIEDAVKVLLQGLGEDINREGLKKTPLRVAKALREGTKGYYLNKF